MGGAKENEKDLRKSYFHHRMEDYQATLNKQPQEQDNYNRSSALSSNMNQIRQPSKDRVSDDNRSAVDFGEILEGKETTTET